MLAFFKHNNSSVATVCSFRYIGDNLICLNIDPFRLPEWPTIQDIPLLIGLDQTSVITTALTTLATIRKGLGKVCFKKILTTHKSIFINIFG